GEGGAVGKGVFQQGRAPEAAEALQRCRKLVRPGHPLHKVTSGLLQGCKRMAALDAKLPAVLQGEARPKDAVEALALAWLCQLPDRQLYAAAARLRADAFAAQPKLADNLRSGDRYLAACLAARAGVGQGR